MNEIAVEAGESPLAAGVMYIDSGITFLLDHKNT